jgi:hypothetical protein
MKTSIKNTLLALAALTASSQAAIVMVLPTATTAGSIQITNDITFTFTSVFSPPSNPSIALDEWVTSDGAATILFPTSFQPTLQYSLNGGPTLSTTFLFQDNIGITAVGYTPNDGRILLNNIVGPAPVPVGGTFTLKATTIVLPAGLSVTGFNPQANQTFTGNAFMLANLGGRITGDASVGGAVPEASSALLGGLSVLGLALRRRRR